MCGPSAQLCARVCFQLPYFMNELTLTELDMGFATPRILGASKPSIDYRGKRELNNSGIHINAHTHTHSVTHMQYNIDCSIS